MQYLSNDIFVEGVFCEREPHLVSHETNGSVEVGGASEVDEGTAIL